MDSLKTILISIGLAIVLGIVASIILIIFIEGWGWVGTITATLLAFGGAGFVMGRIRPQSKIYSGVFIWLPVLLFSLSGNFIQGIFDLLKSPSTINEKNFYVLLPLISLLSAYAGVYFGYRKWKTSIKYFGQTTNTT